MMRDWGLRIIHPRKAVQKGRRAERRLPRQTKIAEHGTLFPDWHAVRRGQSHEKIIRMLPIEQRRFAVRRFARLQQLRITTVADSRRLQGEHRAKSESAGSH